MKDSTDFFTQDNIYEIIKKYFFQGQIKYFRNIMSLKFWDICQLCCCVTVTTTYMFTKVVTASETVHLRHWNWVSGWTWGWGRLRTWSKRARKSRMESQLAACDVAWCSATNLNEAAEVEAVRSIMWIWKKIIIFLN